MDSDTLIYPSFDIQATLPLPPYFPPTNSLFSSDDKKLTTGITNSYKTGQAAESILVVQGVQTDGNVRIKVGSDHASSASASKALEYYCELFVCTSGGSFVLLLVCL